MANQYNDIDKLVNELYDELTDLEVNIQPGSKKAELVSKDKKTKIEMSQEDLLARMQELSGIQQ